MADPKLGDKSGGNEMGLGLIFLLILVGVFIIWVMTNGPEGEKEKSPIEKPAWPAEVPSFGTTQ